MTTMCPSNRRASDEFISRVAARIRARWIARGLTEENLFRAGHLGYRTAVRLYRGTGWHHFTLTTLHRLATALGVSVAELVADDDHDGGSSDDRSMGPYQERLPGARDDRLDSVFTIGYHASVATFPERVRELRRAAGLSQVMLAERAGMSRLHLLRIETAQREPTLGIILKLARALKVTPAKLFEGVGEGRQKPRRGA
jgi:DNA-binding XRE family transcriptional regulator